MKRSGKSRFCSVRDWAARLSVALSLVALVLGLSAKPGGRALADEAAPALLPISPPRLVSVFPATAPNTDTDAYDISLSILDLVPGAATPLQSRPGQLFATVVEGTVTISGAGDETVYGLGDKFTVEPYVVGSMTNAGDDPARLFVTVLSSPGAPDELDQPDSPAPALLPNVVFAGRTTIAAVQGQLVLSQGIFDFVPGAGSGAHSHGGAGIVIVMSGEMTQRIPGGDVKQGVGDVFTEVPGRPVDHRNFGTETATVATSYLTPAGGPAAVPATLAGSPPLLTVPKPAASPTAIPTP